MPELTVVVPTFNEADNLSPLVGELTEALDDIDWEVLFVDDDSPDGTAERARALAQQDPRVRCLQRLGRRGLASACIEGMLASSAPCLAVMDGDLQHDPALLRPMLETLRGGKPTSWSAAVTSTAGASVISRPIVSGSAVSATDSAGPCSRRG